MAIRVFRDYDHIWDVATDLRCSTVWTAKRLGLWIAIYR